MLNALCASLETVPSVAECKASEINLACPGSLDGAMSSDNPISRGLSAPLQPFVNSAPSQLDIHTLPNFHLPRVEYRQDMPRYPRPRPLATCRGWRGKVRGVWGSWSGHASRDRPLFSPDLPPSCVSNLSVTATFTLRVSVICLSRQRLPFVFRSSVRHSNFYPSCFGHLSVTATFRLPFVFRSSLSVMATFTQRVSVISLRHGNVYPTCFSHLSVTATVTLRVSVICPS